MPDDIKKENDFEQSKQNQQGYYHNKEKYDPEHAGNREEGSPKDINDPFYGTGSDSKNKPLEDHKKDGVTDPSIHKEYDGSKNSGGSHSATEKPEN